MNAPRNPMEGAQTPTLPSNEDAEKSLLGAILLNNDVIDTASEYLNPEDFWIAVHGRIFAAMLRLASESKIANPVTLAPLFKDDDSLTEVGGPSYLAKLATQAATVLSVQTYVAEIADMARRRRMIEISEDTALQSRDLEMPAHATLAFATAALDGINEKDRTRTAVRKAGDTMLSAIQYADRAGRDEVKILRTGIRALDEQLGGGLRPQQQVILAGATSMGKSSLLISIVKNMALAGHAGALFSLEMGAQDDNPEIGIKLLSQLSGVPTSDIMAGNNQSLFNALVPVQQRFAKMPLVIDDNGGIRVDYIAAKARSIKRRWGRLDFLAIDYLQIMDHGEGAHQNFAQAIGRTTSRLKQLAKELSVPIIVLSQLNRKLEERSDKRPLLSDLRESGNIEQDADIVLFAYREHYYLSRKHVAEVDADYDQHQQKLRDAESRGEIIVAKARMGRMGRVDARFHGPTQTWHDGNLEWERR